MPAFDLIPAADLDVDQPDFKASKWRPTLIDGRPAEYSECYELVAGRWEGFVSIRRPKSRPRRLPKSITDIFRPLATA